MSAIPPNCDSYFIFHGTGTSSALPLLPCITSADDVKDIDCGACRSCVDESVKEGWKNVRGNTGGIWRKRGPDGVWKNIIIDVGKTFRQNALRIFMEHRIRSVDAVILTHGHADAIAGLDDLRAFNAPLTPDGPKPPPLPIYLSAQTLNAISAQYPYLVDKKKATGGGDVPSLDWRVWGDEWEDEEVGQDVGEGVEGVPRESGFVVCGVKVLPLKVHHGRYFTPPDKARPIDVPITRGTNTPIPASTTPRAEADSITAPMTSVEETVTALTKLTGLNGLLKTTTITGGGNKAKPEQTPFWCYAFLFDQRTLYISDTSFVPSKTWDKLYRAVTGAATTTTRQGPNSPPSTSNKVQPRLLPFSVDSPDLPTKSIETLILDCLRVADHSSHLSYVQALALSMKVNADKTFLVGFTHPDRHVLWEHVGQVIRGESGKQGEDEELQREKETFRARIEQSAKDQGLDGVWEEALRWKGWVDPAFDGQIVKG